MLHSIYYFMNIITPHLLPVTYSYYRIKTLVLYFLQAGLNKLHFLLKVTSLFSTIFLNKFKANLIFVTVNLRCERYRSDIQPMV